MAFWQTTCPPNEDIWGKEDLFLTCDPDVLHLEGASPGANEEQNLRTWEHLWENLSNSFPLLSMTQIPPALQGPAEERAHVGPCGQVSPHQCLSYLKSLSGKKAVVSVIVWVLWALSKVLSDSHQCPVLGLLGIPTHSGSQPLKDSSSPRY